MSKLSHDDCIIITMLQRLWESRLPRALRLKEKVDEGRTLNPSDISFLERGHQSAQRIMPLIDKHPRYQAVFAGVIHLYHQITEQALDNEQGSSKAVSAAVFAR